MTIQLKAGEQNIAVVLFILMYKMFLIFVCVNEIQKCDHSIESW